MRALLLVCSLILVVPVAAAAAFALAPDVQARLDLRVVPAPAMRYRAQAEGTGRTVELSSLIDLAATLAADEAILEASAAAYRRAQVLHADADNASLAELQAARAQWLGARAQHDAAHARLRLLAGAFVGDLDAPARRALLQRLGAGQAVLLRADFPPGSTLARSPQVQVLRLDGTRRLPARVLGPALDANPDQPGPGLWLLVERPDWLRAGQAVAVLADAAAPAQDGVHLPQGALLHRDGGLWCYVRIDAQHFERRRIDHALPLADGVFVVAAVAPGEAVVVQGAASLLAAELAPSDATGAADEDD